MAKKVVLGCLTALSAVVIVCAVVGMFAAVGCNSQPQTHATASMIPGSATSDAQPDSKVYDVFSLNDDKNQIPTGTALSVKGLFLQIRWTHFIRCDQLLMYGHAPIQHGEADPLSYCRFYVYLTGKRGAAAGGGDTFPVYGAVCNATPSELRKDLKLYRYGEPIQIHGLYAPSLDFTISPVGVPRLNNCTVTPVELQLREPQVRSAPDYTKQAQQIYSLMDKDYRDHPADGEGRKLQPPRLMVSVPPTYPPDAWAAHVSGTVTLGATIDINGKPVNTHIVDSVSPSLDAAALQAFSQYQFEPAHNSITGAPVSSSITQEINFPAH